MLAVLLAYFNGDNLTTPLFLPLNCNSRSYYVDILFSLKLDYFSTLGFNSVMLNIVFLVFRICAICINWSGFVNPSLFSISSRFFRIYGSYSVSAVVSLASEAFQTLGMNISPSTCFSRLKFCLSISLYLFSMMCIVCPRLRRCLLLIFCSPCSCLSPICFSITSCLGDYTGCKFDNRCFFMLFQFSLWKKYYSTSFCSCVEQVAALSVGDYLARANTLFS